MALDTSDKGPDLALSLPVFPMHRDPLSTLDQALTLTERLSAFIRRNRLTDEERARVLADAARRKERRASRLEAKGKIAKAADLRRAAGVLRRQAEELSSE